MSLPSLNPLQAPQIICPTCGALIAAEPVRVGKARVTEVLYACTNEEKGCKWFVKATLTHITGEGPLPMKQEEVDRRRAEAATIKRYQELRENSVSELIAILPHLKEILQAFREASAERTAKAETDAVAEREPVGAGTGTGS